ncbi:MAG: hypothetical protein HWE26_03395 [Alteromonadaceae bacterium]|nr:hypothetical protein [Alteromonadaceae bacterium]
MPITEHYSKHGFARGAAVMSTVALLLVLASIVSVYTARIRSFEQKIQRNTLNYQNAHNVAQAGLEQAVGQLIQHPLWSGSMIGDSQVGAGSYEVGLSRQAIVQSVVPEVLVSLTARGRSADGLARVNIQEDVIIAPLLQRLPPAPVMTNSKVSPALAFTLVANPNGAGEGVPLSMWTKEPLPGAALNGISCAVYEYQTGHCATRGYSGAAGKGLDIVDQSAQFPGDLNDWLFGIAESDWRYLLSLSNAYATTCDGLDRASGGLIWVSGNCKVARDSAIGSQHAPVVLVIHNGGLEMAGDARIYGLVYFFRAPDHRGKSAINMDTGAAIRGALVANQAMGEAEAQLTVLFDAKVMSGLLEQELLLRVSRVPGSWRDF